MSRTSQRHDFRRIASHKGWPEVKELEDSLRDHSCTVWPPLLALVAAAMMMDALSSCSSGVVDGACVPGYGGYEKSDLRPEGGGTSAYWVKYPGRSSLIGSPGSKEHGVDPLSREGADVDDHCACDTGKLFDLVDTMHLRQKRTRRPNDVGSIRVYHSDINSYAGPSEQHEYVLQGKPLGLLCN